MGGIADVLHGGGFVPGGFFGRVPEPEPEAPATPISVSPARRAGIRRLALPVRLAGDTLASVAQGSAEDVDQRVTTLLAFRPGQRMGSEEFGSDPEHFEQTPDLQALAETVVRWDAAADAQITGDGRDLTGVVQRAVLRIGNSGGVGG